MWIVDHSQTLTLLSIIFKSKFKVLHKSGITRLQSPAGDYFEAKFRWGGKLLMLSKSKASFSVLLVGKTPQALIDLLPCHQRSITKQDKTNFGKQISVNS